MLSGLEAVVLRDERGRDRIESMGEVEKMGQDGPGWGWMLVFQC